MKSEEKLVEMLTGIMNELYAIPVHTKLDLLEQRLEKLERLFRLLILGDIKTLPGHEELRNELRASLGGE